MEYAVHMKNRKTGVVRIKKVVADNIDHAFCNDFFYGSVWMWTGTEPWRNVSDKAVHVGRGYYKIKSIAS